MSPGPIVGPGDMFDASMERCSGIFGPRSAGAFGEQLCSFAVRWEESSSKIPFGMASAICIYYEPMPWIIL